MSASKRWYTEEYQQMISVTNSSHWTQFELDLIRCIRDEYPVIYTKTGDWTSYQRPVKVREAWKKIGAKFNDIPLESIKSKWKSLVQHYYKLKKNADMSVSENEKFFDGTFGFLDSELGLFDKQEKNNVKAGPSKEATKENKIVGEESENSSSMDVGYDHSIRQLIHEEIDIDDDEIEIKEEEEYDNSDDDSNLTIAEQGTAQPDHNATEECEFDKDVREPPKKWDEEELMNATRLTKEMVQELLLIKTRQYYTASATVNK